MGRYFRFVRLHGVNLKYILLKIYIFASAKPNVAFPNFHILAEKLLSKISDRRPYLWTYISIISMSRVLNWAMLQTNLPKSFHILRDVRIQRAAPSYIHVWRNVSRFPFNYRARAVYEQGFLITQKVDCLWCGFGIFRWHWQGRKRALIWIVLLDLSILHNDHVNRRWDRI